MLVVFILIGYNIKENFNDHRYVSTSNVGCSRGFYCPKNSRDKIPCPRGYYCPDGKKRIKCKQGSFCPGNTQGLEGDSTPTRSYKEQICPDGFYCPSVGLLNGTIAKRCPNGKICCYRGETEEEILSGGCKTPDELRNAIADKTTYPGSIGWRSRSTYKNCPPGYYCPVNALGESIGTIEKCQSGDYCPSGSTVPSNCPKGFYCPEVDDGLGNKLYGTIKVRCEVEKISSSENKENNRNCEVADDGFAYCAPSCPERSIVRDDCRRGFHCPSVNDPENENEKLFGTKQLRCGEKNINGIPGYLAEFVDVKKDDGSIVKKPIRGGLYQKFKGATKCKECPLGISSNNARVSCRGCPMGHYCDDINSDPKKCPKGTYVHKTYSCKDGEPCRGGSRQDIESNPQIAEFPNQCFKCLPGTYQDKTGSFQCNECPKGTSQALEGKDTCLACPAGTYQDNVGAESCKTCRDGYFCSNCLEQKTELGCNVQDCYWDKENEICQPKSAIYSELSNIEIDPEDWRRLGLTSDNISVEDAIKLIKKSKTIASAQKDKVEVVDDRNEIAGTPYQLYNTLGSSEINKRLAGQ